MKIIERNGKFYRIRRGVQVPIPPEWVGKVPHPQTIRKRPSKRGQGRSFRAKPTR